MSRGGLRAALGHGAVAFALPLLFGETLALLRAAGPIDPTAWAVLRAGALAPSFVHRVPVEVRLVDISGPEGLFGGAFEVGFTVRVALLLATAGAGWVLFRGGRVAGSPREGLLVAVPYTLLSALAALLARGSDPAILLGAGFAGLGETEAWPSPLWSVVLPAALAVACGAAGGLSASRPAEGRLRAAAAGAWRMTWLLVAGGTAGVLVVVALHPDATRAFLDALGARGWAGGAAVLLVTILLLPNVGIGAGVAAMGVPIVLRSGGSTCALISLGGTPCGELSVDVSPAHLLFVLVPVAATVGGGWWAARRLERTTAARAAAVGAAAGALFAPVLVAVSFMASAAYRLTGPLAGALGEGSVTVGPRPAGALLGSIAWGIAGGGIGALAAHARGTGPGDGPGPNVSRVRRYAAGGRGGPPTLLSWKRM
ncbi:MAG: cell division protein PerM [Actinomycetota bacterium]